MNLRISGVLAITAFVVVCLLGSSQSSTRLAPLRSSSK
jgi:hypothetical protein